MKVIVNPKIILLAVSFLLCKCTVQSVQDTQCNGSDLSFIKNSNVSYHIGMFHVKDSMLQNDKEELCDTCPIISPFITKYQVIIELTESQKKSISSLNSDCWISLLESDSADWAANLVLYCIAKKNASIYFADSVTEQTWKKYYKREDVEFWKRELKK